MIVFNRSRVFVVAYALYWTVCASFKGMVYENIKSTIAVHDECYTKFQHIDSGSRAMLSLFTFIFTAKGLVTMAVRNTRCRWLQACCVWLNRGARHVRRRGCTLTT